MSTKDDVFLAALTGLCANPAYKDEKSDVLVRRARVVANCDPDLDKADPHVAAPLYPQFVAVEPTTTPPGRLCGLCDGTHGCAHPQSRCRLCGAVGLTENVPFGCGVPGRKPNECRHGVAFTLDDIRDSIACMRRRFAEGQGRLSDAMCRLSLPMAETLLHLVDEVDK